MRRVVLVLLVLALTSWNASAQQDTIEVRVKLVTNLDTVELLPYCGHMMWRTTFDFEILEVLNGTYTDKSIKVSITCPREAVEFKRLLNGGVYYYHLTKRKRIKELEVGQKNEVEFLDDYDIVFLN